MNRLFIVLIALLLIAGCATDMGLEVVLVKDEEQIRELCGDDMMSEPLGCARGGVMTIPPSDCRIVALEPRGFDDHRRLETLGHELWHCLKGRTHL